MRDVQEPEHKGTLPLYSPFTHVWNKLSSTADPTGKFQPSMSYSWYTFINLLQVLSDYTFGWFRMEVAFKDYCGNDF